MMIDRKKLLKRNHPILRKWEAESPLTVGNGEFAFTADVTGLQSFYEEQEAAHVPLCTMSQWGWHSTPAGPERNIWYQPDQVKKTAYDSVHGTQWYASEVQPGNEEIYHWLRENPHRLNLGRIGFLWEGKEIHPGEVSEIYQELFLEEGVLKSRFTIHNCPVEVETVCAGEEDTLGISIQSEALLDQRLTVLFAFPYGSKEISASDWKKESWHETKCSCLQEETGMKAVWTRTLDRTTYQVSLQSDMPAELLKKGAHAWTLEGRENALCFSIHFSSEEKKNGKSFREVKESSKKKWNHFWENCGMVELEGSKDPRAGELERRIVLSEYLLGIQSLGSLPPQETGLTCNSWYGKFHLEMYPWHCAWAPLWNLPDSLKGSLEWYRNHLEAAKKNAACNGFSGARWPKMVDPDAVDSPSAIATLLIWQQPHILWMLELVYQATKEEELLQRFWEVIRETARFMCDFVSYNEKTGRYDLPAPLIPAQEEHDPRTTRNPAYELEYWSFALKLAADWAEKLGEDGENWRKVGEQMALPPEQDGLYLACETCPDTFTDFAKDHPSMTAAFGLLPGERIEKKKMSATLDRVLECWDYPTMWGWDFAMLAMTAVRLGEPEKAIEILLKDTPKNSYVTSGNNYQRMRTDLPLYLPGNGSLLLAVAMMTAGYAGCQEKLPGFPKNGQWEVAFEKIMPFPY
jgi:hypothetical protein